MRSAPVPLLLLLLLAPVPARAGGSIAGVCPDGSIFIVQHARDVPCTRAKIVEPSSIPPLRPELLPRPYPWLVDQESRNPNNPYNMLDTAEKIRAARERSSSAVEGATAGEPSTAHAPPPKVARATPPPRRGPALSGEDLGSLLEIVGLRQELAPALLTAEDAMGNGRLEVRFAYSRTLEGRILSWLGRDRGHGTVLLFAVQAVQPGEFHPNFFFLQESRGFRPDPEIPEEVDLLLGEPGPLEVGATRLGYVVLPARFSPEQPMELWWNDRRVDATLDPLAIGG